MDLLVSYIPLHLAETLRERGCLPTVPSSEKFPASLLFSDISGFTSLTERLQGRGRAGAEEMTDVIKAAFRPALAIIHKHEGSIFSFGGDAIFVLFRGVAPVRRAEAAASAIRDLFDRRPSVPTSVGPVALAISQAIHFGTVIGMHLGSPRRRQYLVCGHPVKTLARLESQASAGEVLLSRAAKAQLRREGKVAPTTKAHSSIPARILKPYIRQDILASRHRFRGAFRPVVMVFFETRTASTRVLQRFYLTLLAVLERYEGILVSPDLSTKGTKWLCAFGAPVAHEDDPDRAALASLDLLQSVPAGIFRGGMHTGTAANIWVGSRRRRSLELMGDVTNTAARAAAKAEWGEVVATEECRLKLTAVSTKDRGKHAAKGKKAALHLHAIAARQARGRTIRATAPMVGRQKELTTIEEAMVEAAAGHGAVIVVTGEAGIGKTRLRHEAARRARQCGLSSHTAAARSFGEQAYGTIGSLLRAMLGLAEGEPASRSLECVSHACRELRLSPTDRHHLAELLGHRFPNSPIVHLDADNARLNNRLAAAAFLRASGEVRPRLIVLEEMQWADPSSIDIVRELAREAPKSRYLLLILSRQPIETVDGAREISLEGLSGKQLAELCRIYLGDAIPSSLLAQLVERAGGNPLFLEELVRHLSRSGLLQMTDDGYQLRRRPSEDDLPPRLEALIAARLDRLPPDARLVAQNASAIGQTFREDILNDLPGIRRKARKNLQILLETQIVLMQAEKPIASYCFDQALTRDVAYAGMLTSQRRSIHLAVAETIERRFEKDLSPFLPMLGYHWERANQTDRARERYLAAARNSVDRHALEESEQLYRSCLSLFVTPCKQSIRARNELAESILQCQGRMGEAEAEHLCALSEARSIGETSEVIASLRELGVVKLNTGQMEDAARLLRQALQMARKVGADREVGMVLGRLAVLELDTGRMKPALRRFQQALKMARSRHDRLSECSIESNRALVYRSQGYPKKARRLFRKALRIARELGRRRNEGIALANLAIVSGDLGHLEDAAQLYGRAALVAREVGDRRLIGATLQNLAWVRQTQGANDDAVALLEEALEIAHQTRNPRLEGYSLGNLANALLAASRRKEARQLFGDDAPRHASARRHAHGGKLDCQPRHDGSVRWIDAPSQEGTAKSPGACQERRGSPTRGNPPGTALCMGVHCNRQHRRGCRCFGRWRNRAPRSRRSHRTRESTVHHRTRPSLCQGRCRGISRTDQDHLGRICRGSGLGSCPPYRSSIASTTSLRGRRVPRLRLSPSRSQRRTSEVAQEEPTGALRRGIAKSRQRQEEPRSSGCATSQFTEDGLLRSPDSRAGPLPCSRSAGRGQAKPGRSDRGAFLPPRGAA